MPGSYEITVSARGFEQETKTCTVLPNKAAVLNFELKRMRMREPRQPMDDDTWPRARIPDGAGFKSEQSRQVERTGNGDDDFDDTARRGFYYQGNSERLNDEYPVTRNYPHPK